MNVYTYMYINCLVHFRDQYYKYTKKEDPFKKVLSIGEYDSTWLADLVACFILHETEPEWWAQFTSLKSIAATYTDYLGTQLYQSCASGLPNSNELQIESREGL